MSPKGQPGRKPKNQPNNESSVLTNNSNDQSNPCSIKDIGSSQGGT